MHSVVVVAVRTMTPTTRSLGIEFGELRDEFEHLPYPIANADLLERHGNATLSVPNGDYSLEEVLAPFETSSYDDSDDVLDAIFTMVGEQAIGRKFYSDRTPPALGEDRPDDELSF
jgi:hypothetical protein